MLNIFPWTYWSFIYLLLWSVSTSCLPIYNQVIRLYWVLSVFIIFWIYICFANIFSWFVTCPLYFLNGIFFLVFEFHFFFIQRVLISHQFYTHQCIHVNPNLQFTTPSIPHWPPDNTFWPLFSLLLPITVSVPWGHYSTDGSEVPDLLIAD